MEWVEVRGRTVEVAVAAALQELGLDSPQAAEVEVLQEPERGFLGIGGREAIVRVKPRPQPRKRRRRRGRGGGQQTEGERKGSEAGTEGRRRQQERGRPRSRSGDGNQAGGGKRSGRGRSDRDRPRPARAERGATGDEEAQQGMSMTEEEQAGVVQGFLAGLLEAFGLEGTVEVGVDGDVLVATVLGEQTAALVGAKGAILEAVHELCRTVLQRQTRNALRLRLDIAGYGERRREALRIYAAQLADQVKEERGEVMLEPMSAGDRKVIHDAIAEIEGVRSYSEGEAPRRYVVIAPAVDGED